MDVGSTTIDKRLSQSASYGSSQAKRKRKRFDSLLCQKHPTSTEKKHHDKTKTPPKISITQRLQTELGRSLELTIATQLVWLNRFTGSQPTHETQKLCNKKDTHIKISNTRWMKANIMMKYVTS